MKTGEVDLRLRHRGSQAGGKVARVLLASKTHYMQVLEGSDKSVIETFTNITYDPWHVDVWLMARDVIDARLLAGGA